MQFGLTVGFHFIFSSLSIGLAWFIVWAMTRYKRTDSDMYRGLARFWVKVFAATFAVGAATGVTMEFQFGTNWANYSRFVGDVFGPPLAIEAIFAFFLEATFLGLLVFGWDRITVKMQWFASVMVAVGATLSALWILIANSWQQTPAGYRIVDGRAQLTDLLAAAANPSTLPRFLHTVDACIMTGAFFAMGITACFLLKHRHVKVARESMRAALVIALISSVAQLGFGHHHAQQVANTQPAKLAAFESLFDDCKNAPLVLFGIPQENSCSLKGAIGVPGLLSILIYGRADAEVKGLKSFPRDEWPPVALAFYPYHAMVIIGGYLIAFSLLGGFLFLRDSLHTNRWFLRAAILSIPIPFIATELGWMAAECGRQPWTVYGVLRTRDAISVSVPSGQILFSMIVFGLIYVLLFSAWVFVIAREFKHGLELNESTGEVGY
ncbi:MAG: cytochrome ubiquinol oxidase subunit I [Armatimonadota bacterium]|nr:cytochrome ubiquinol oxidase subunit I [bacterium]